MITLEIGKKVTYGGLTHDKSTYYYCTDTKEVFKGDISSEQTVRIVAVEPHAPSQGVLYILDGSVLTFDGKEYNNIGSAYIMGTNELYTTDVAINAASYNTAAQTTAEPQSSVNVVNVDLAKDNLNNSLDNGYFSNEMSVIPAGDALVRDGLSTYSISAVNNIHSWDSQSSNEHTIVYSYEELQAIENPSEGMSVEVYDTDTDSSILYVYDDGIWVIVSDTVNLSSYYQNVDYIATPLSSVGSMTMLTVTASIAEEEIDAIDYTGFAQVSGAASLGVVEAPTVNDYSTDTATVAFVATSIAAATQRLQVYVDELTGLFDPLGAADQALENAIKYIDNRLMWHTVTNEEEYIT